MAGVTIIRARRSLLVAALSITGLACNAPPELAAGSSDPPIAATEADATLAARGAGVDVELDAHGISLRLPRRGGAELTAGEAPVVRVSLVGAAMVPPEPEGRRDARVNRLVGPRAAWRTGLPTWERVVWPQALPGVDLLATVRRAGVDYRLRLAGPPSAGGVRMRYEGVDALAVMADGGALSLTTGAGTLTETGLAAYQRAAFVWRRLEARYDNVVRVGPATWEVDIRLAGTWPVGAIEVDPSIGWGSFLGGDLSDDEDSVAAIRADAGSNLVLAGTTGSKTYPTTAGALARVYRGGNLDVVVTKIAADGGSILWSTYLGGSRDDRAAALALDAGGNVILTGNTTSTDFPLVKAFTTTTDANDGRCFVAELSANGATLVFSSLVEATQCHALVRDTTGDLYLGGETAFAFSYPLAFGAPPGANHTGFLAKLPAAGTSVTWAAYYGGAATERVYGLAVNSTHNLIAVGQAASPDLPNAAAGFGAVKGTGSDAFVARIAANGSGVDWSSYLGGNGDFDAAYAVTVDDVDRIYVVGTTNSSDFPVPNGFDTTLTAATDGFVTKIADTVPPTLVWSSYLGGTTGIPERAHAVAVDSGHDVFVAGVTNAADFPVGTGGYDTTVNGGDGFVVRIAAAGIGVTWGTYVGGSLDEALTALTLTPAGQVVVAGVTGSSDLPIAGGFDATLDGKTDFLVAELSTAGAVAWSSYLGGTVYFDDSGVLPKVRVATGGDLVIAGVSASPTFPVTAGHDQTFGGANDAVIARVAANGAILRWATFLGGDSRETLTALVLDASDNIYVAGRTMSADFPLVGAADGVMDDPVEGYVVKLNPTGDTILWSTYFGGSGTDEVTDLALGSTGTVYLTGHTGSAALPGPAVGGYDTTGNGGEDAFVAALAGTGATILWSTFLGGSLNDAGSTLVVDETSGIYVAGTTLSKDFPVAAAFDSASRTALSSNSSGFVSKLSLDGSQLLWSSWVGTNTSGASVRRLVPGPGGTPALFVAGSTTGTIQSSGIGFDLTQNGSSDLFLMKVTATGGLSWSSYLGGSGWDDLGDAALLDGATLVLTGYTTSTDFPVTTGAISGTLRGAQDAFLVWVSAAGTILPGVVTYLGGNGSDAGTGIALGGAWTYVVGDTTSPDLPVPGGFDRTLSGTADAFILAINPLACQPTDTTCDNVDDDCNGVADDGFVGVLTTCGVGACAAVGSHVCVAGVNINTCTPGAPAASDAVCNGVDNDCDGTTDEHYVADTSCGVGYCRTTNRPSVCASGAQTPCMPGTRAESTDLTCNGVDGDCDGAVDEDYVPDASCGVGYCHTTAVPSSCVNGGVSPCAPGAPLAATDTTCDGVDDDCSGAADEDYNPDASCGVGYCHTTAVPSSCVGGVASPCVPGTRRAAVDSTCDGVDDDCDGFIDDDVDVAAVCPAPSSVCAVAVCSPTTAACAESVRTGCCAGDGDCTTGATCILGSCAVVAGQCTYATPTGCCTSDADCDDTNPCTTSSCDPASGACNLAFKPYCCTTHADCDDADPCSYDECTPDHYCRHRPSRCATTSPCGADVSCMYGYVHLSPGAASPAVTTIVDHQETVVLQFRLQTEAVGGTLTGLSLSVTGFAHGLGLKAADFALYRDDDADGALDPDSEPLGTVSAVTLDSGRVAFIGLPQPLTIGMDSHFIVTLLVRAAQPGDLGSSGWLAPPSAWPPALAALLLLVGALVWSRGPRRRWLTIAALALLVQCSRSEPGVSHREASVAIAGNDSVAVVTAEHERLWVDGAPVPGATFDVWW